MKMTHKVKTCSYIDIIKITPLLTCHISVVCSCLNVLKCCITYCCNIVLLPVLVIGWLCIALFQDSYPYYHTEKRKIIIACCIISQDGIFIRGLFLEGAAWDKDNVCLTEPQPMQLVCAMPVIHFKPVKQRKKEKTKGSLKT